MNELLGWYGYDKVELKDGEDIEFRSYPTDGESRQHISVLKGNELSPPARVGLLWVSFGCHAHTQLKPQVPILWAVTHMGLRNCVWELCKLWQR